MATVSITQAAKLAGVSRSTLYRKYISTGQLSVISDHNGKKKIDTSELLRVFGELKKDSETALDNADTLSHKQIGTVPDTPINQVQSEAPGTYQVTPKNSDTASRLEVESLKIKLSAAEQQVQALQQDKTWYQSQISQLTDTMKLLEGPKHPRLWWQFWK